MKKLQSLLIATALTATSSTVLAAQSNESKSPYLYGVGVAVKKEIYKGYSSRTVPLPLIGYRGEKLNVFGPFVSYKVANLDDLSISVQLSPRFQGFDDSDSDFFEGMDKRKDSLDAGLGLDYKQGDWQFQLSSLFDVLGNSKGYELKSGVSYTQRYGPVFITPSASLSYLDSKHVDYYYGVKMNEINEFRSAYEGDSALNTTAGLSIATPIFFGGMTRATLEYTWYDDPITDSPIVEEDTSLSFGVFFTKHF